MVVIHPACRAAAGRLPLPHVGIDPRRRRVVQAAARHGGGRIRNRLRAGVESAVAREVDVQCREQDRELVLVEGMLVAVLIAFVKQVPSIDLLDQRQLLE